MLIWASFFSILRVNLEGVYHLHGFKEVGGHPTPLRILMVHLVCIIIGGLLMIWLGHILGVFIRAFIRKGAFIRVNTVDVYEVL